MFPGMFPKVIDYGKTDITAYFDMEYCVDAVNAQEYVNNCSKKKEVDMFFNSLSSSISALHHSRIKSSEKSIELYAHEEIKQRLQDCYQEDFFVDFLKNDKIIFNGVEVNSFIKSFDLYNRMIKKYYVRPTETFTHGNMTLENILYVPKDDKIIFIDPYEENVVDSELAEYSQLLQSSNSKYEIYNSKESLIDGNKISLQITESFGMEYFNKLLIDHLKIRFNDSQYVMIRLLEVSQFIRMLPFKMAIDKNKMIFFYGLASYLFDKLQDECELLKTDFIDNVRYK